MVSDRFDLVGSGSGQGDDLIYRGEGNSSLVVALKSKRQVIRLLKTDAKKLKNKDDVLEHLRVHIDFNQIILPTCLNRAFFCSPRLIELDPLQVTLIRNLVKDKRPSFRLEKNITESCHALLMPDYCCLPSTVSSIMTPTTTAKRPVLAIEIKPKQGFIPDASQFEDDASLWLKSRLCKYSMAQSYKCKKQSISERSNYCPLDLFSGCFFRIFRALDELFRRPQNNLRIFADAQLVYGDQAQSARPISEDTLACTLKQFFDCGNDVGVKSSSDWENESEDDEKDLQLVNEIRPKFDEDEDDDTESGFNSGCEEMSSSITLPYKKSKRSFDQLFTLKFLIYQALTKGAPERKANEANFNFVNVRRHFNRPGSVTQMNSYFRNFIEMFDNNEKEELTPLILSDMLVLSSSCLALSSTKSRVFNEDLYRASIADLDPKLPLPCMLHLKVDQCCFAEKKHYMAPNCVLSTILKAQMLDKLDSLKAAQSFNQLCLHFRSLKAKMCLEMVDEPLSTLTENMLLQLVERFIDENEKMLDELWAFLISLTAKDCSIMIAIERQTIWPSKASFRSFSNEKTVQGPALIPLMDDISLSEQYIASVAITDLDFKPGHKILRMLANDRRMIEAFCEQMLATECV